VSGGISADVTRGPDGGYAINGGGSLQTKYGGGGVELNYGSHGEDWGLNGSANFNTKFGDVTAGATLSYDDDGSRMLAGNLGVKTAVVNANADARYAYSNDGWDVGGALKVDTDVAGVNAQTSFSSADGRYDGSANLGLTTPWGKGELGGTYSARPDGTYGYSGNLQLGGFNTSGESSSSIIASEEGDFLRNRTSVNVGGYNLYESDNFTPRGQLLQR